jgi:post-segregation antitoxin (ccd killing protein)
MIIVAEREARWHAKRFPVSDMTSFLSRRGSVAATRQRFGPAMPT